jgi:hypothetical protein
MGYLYVYAAFIAIVILNSNLTVMMKRIKNGKETIFNTMIGIVCSVVIFVAILQICG